MCAPTYTNIQRNAKELVPHTRVVLEFLRKILLWQADIYFPRISTSSQNQIESCVLTASGKKCEMKSCRKSCPNILTANNATHYIIRKEMTKRGRRPKKRANFHKNILIINIFFWLLVLPFRRIFINFSSSSCLLEFRMARRFQKNWQTYLLLKYCYIY